ncbi:hypothetical protein EG329_002794 [Mollisiaceae sp. DMI_Dod_QoI]|nr:hypothetical protein EG329_002794 [Helotiales sp. DMI_Dod_QoI]
MSGEPEASVKERRQSTPPRYFSREPRSTPNLHISEEVCTALRSNRPVVALESTIYTHGFPFPDNIALALGLEKIVRKHGAVPATIGILGGIARVGLTELEIRTLASAAGKPETMKVSRRDLPYILGMGITGKKLNGGTTVAATMILAGKAGISVFGTGGLGGVHRGAENTMDISADLTELGRTGVAVVSSGCKSFLDIPKTLEYLETQGVPVCTFANGRTGAIEFPAFYTRESGVRSPAVIQSPREAAAIIYAQELLQLSRTVSRSGFLFANPIPEKHSIPKAEIDEAINQAVQEAAEQGFHGHTNTPFILSRIKELTKGNSIPANRALIESNVEMAAKVAVELARLREEPFDFFGPSTNPSNSSNYLPSSSRRESPTKALSISPDIIVLGSVAIDLSCNYSPRAVPSATTDVSPKMHTSNIATITPSIGGVGHNVALAAHRAGKQSSVSLRSLVAEDLLENRTAQYVAVNDASKNLVLAMADMSLFSTASIYPAEVLEGLLEHSHSRNTWTVVDANWATPILQRLFSSRDANTKIVFEPVSVPKAGRIFEPTEDFVWNHTLQVFPNNDIHLATPNQYELAAMHDAAKKHNYLESQKWWHVIDSLGIPSSGARDRFVSITNQKLTDEGIPLRTTLLLPLIPTILTKLGSEGVLLTELLKPDDPRLTDPEAAPFVLSRTANGSTEVGGIYMRLFPPAEVVEDVVSVNGVGDTFLGVLVAGLAQGCKLDEKLIHIAQRGAVMTLKSKESVSPELDTLSQELIALAKKERGKTD